ncbi:MAG: hypothetical protein ACJAXZ_001380 [Akkermansiaceae bacterium]|jgi:hypothetical protein
MKNIKLFDDARAIYPKQDIKTPEILKNPAKDIPFRGVPWLDGQGRSLKLVKNNCYNMKNDFWSFPDYPHDSNLIEEGAGCKFKPYDVIPGVTKSGELFFWAVPSTRRRLANTFRDLVGFDAYESRKCSQWITTTKPSSWRQDPLLGDSMLVNVHKVSHEELELTSEHLRFVNMTALLKQALDSIKYPGL